MLSNRSYLTSSQHCNLHNMSLFMARKCPGITRTRDQVVNTTGASFSFRNRKGLRVDGLDLETAETMYKTEAKCICIIFLDSACKLDHMMFDFLCLANFTQYDNL